MAAELIKTQAGASGAGSLTAGVLSKIFVAEAPSYYLMSSIGSSNIVPVACAITTPNLTFPIGDVSASNFGSTIGTIPSGAQNTQNLGLNCDAGANINVSLNGTQNPDVSTASVLALTGQGNAGVAKGVGVQIIYNGAPLTLNTNVPLKQSAGGQETFPITARYYQTKTAVMPGTANTSATLNLTYQ
uniref:Putative fimbrial protein n=1 Tax=termite gut metagenome TaxID=433724 RepID=S0DEB9_9ZZZZ